MEQVKNNVRDNLKAIIFSQEFSQDDYDETAYIMSHPATAREILEGLETPWEECISEEEAME